ncbi:hypothetical protein JTE90_009563 [Oedothorax gibbosus]|uniref:Protein dead ringer n=1 Tax=Oedothorax gibbosus TaxID=931172 RepID=A0AAV6V191_9ARAC|nr:hypothetical protein JTE90_009563 [Oedothorax gibbosus]
MSNPEEEGEEGGGAPVLLQGESEFESDDLSGDEAEELAGLSHLRLANHDKRRQEMEQQILMREDYLSSPQHRRPGSKSTTPSPSSPPHQQYLYAAGHPLAAFLSPSQLAAAQAAAVASMAAAHHQAQAAALGGGGGSSTGSATPPNNGGGMASPSGRGLDPDQSKYTYEEQFKQLYELSDDPRRKEFLDDLFNYMQKRGTPVNRIPIMAKQVLDLYELYRLVVARGGLVEVINKKIWREITKGLNLPSSITSAAFTLRTQYMKYLYPYECIKEKLSTNDELQAAIDGNRREGRRSSYGPYPDIVSTQPPSHRNSHHPPPNHHSPLGMMPPRHHMNGHGPPMSGGGRVNASSPLSMSYYAPPQHNNAHLPLNLAPAAAPQENGIYNHALSSGEEDKSNSVPSTPNPMVMPQQEALNLEVSSRSSTTTNNNNNSSNNNNNNNNEHKPLNMRKQHFEEDVRPSKRLLMEEERLHSRSTISMPSTHIKITNNRGPDGRTQNDSSSLTVTMEVNGIMYQGLLFAVPNQRNRL